MMAAPMVEKRAASMVVRLVEKKVDEKAASKVEKWAEKMEYWWDASLDSVWASSKADSKAAL